MSSSSSSSSSASSSSSWSAPTGFGMPGHADPLPRPAPHAAGQGPFRRCCTFKLAGNLHLLGLGSAAPHWLDPLERPEPGQAPLCLHCWLSAQQTDPPHSPIRVWRAPASVQVQPYPLCGPHAYADELPGPSGPKKKKSASLSRSCPECPDPRLSRRARCHGAFRRRTFSAPRAGPPRRMRARHQLPRSRKCASWWRISARRAPWPVRS